MLLRRWRLTATFGPGEAAAIVKVTDRTLAALCSNALTRFRVEPAARAPVIDDGKHNKLQHAQGAQAHARENSHAIRFDGSAPQQVNARCKKGKAVGDGAEAINGSCDHDKFTLTPFCP